MPCLARPTADTTPVMPAVSDNEMQGSQYSSLISGTVRAMTWRLRESTMNWLIFAPGSKETKPWMATVRKNMCKLLLIFLLEHDIDFGHMDAVNFLSSNKYTEADRLPVHLSASELLTLS